MGKRQLRVHASRFSRALIDLMRTAGGDAVAFQPDSPNLFLAHLVVEHVDWRENWKSLFDRHLHHRIDRILPAFLAPQRFRYKIEFRSALVYFRAALETEATSKKRINQIDFNEGIAAQIAHGAGGGNISKHDGLIVHTLSDPLGDRLGLPSGVT